MSTLLDISEAVVRDLKRTELVADYRNGDFTPTKRFIEIINAAQRWLDRKTPNRGEFRRFSAKIERGDCRVTVPGIRFIEKIDIEDGKSRYIMQKQLYAWMRDRFNYPFETSPKGLPAYWTREPSPFSSYMSIEENVWPARDLPSETLLSICYDSSTIYAAWVEEDVSGKTAVVIGFDKTGTTVFERRYGPFDDVHHKICAKNANRFCLISTQSGSERRTYIINMNTDSEYVLHEHDLSEYHYANAIETNGTWVCAITHSGDDRTFAHRIDIGLTNKVTLELSGNTQYGVRPVVNSSDMFFLHETDGLVSVPLASFSEERRIGIQTPDSVTASVFMIGGDDELLYFCSPTPDSTLRYRIFMTDLSGRLLHSASMSEGIIAIHANPPYFVTFDGSNDLGLGRISIHTGESSDCVVLFMPPADKSYTMHITGSYYARTFEKNSDVSWWSDKHPDILIRAVKRQVAIDKNRNTTEIRDWTQPLYEDIRDLQDDVYREVNAGDADEWRMKP